MNIPEIAPTERQRFEDWYTLNAFDLAANPIGSRDCGLQWKAWQASRQPTPEAALQPRTAEQIASTQAWLDGLAHPPKPTTEAPPAYMFSVRRVSPAGQPSLDTFAAIDYHCQDGEELKSKEPLFYGVAPKPPAEWMDAAANDIGKLFQNRWERAYMEPVMPQEIEAIIAKHHEHAPKVPEGEA